MLRVALVVFLSSCAAVRPSGFPVEEDHSSFEATFVPPPMFSGAPSRWSLSDGREIKLVVDTEWSHRGWWLTAGDFAFEVSLGDQALRCRTRPTAPELPVTSFICVGDDAHPAQLTLAPGRRDCAANTAKPSAMFSSDPTCWNGELRVGERRFTLRRGHFDGTGVPAPYVVWADDQGRPALAAQFVVSHATLFYELEGFTIESLDSLTLASLALAWWHHADKND